MKSLRAYSGRTIIFATLVFGIVLFVLFVFVTVVFDLGERRYVVVLASDYARTNRTDFSQAVDALPRLDTVSPDGQKKVERTVNNLKKIHFNFNALEDVFEEYASHIQAYTELKKNMSISKGEERKKTIKNNTAKISASRKQITVLEKQIATTKKALMPVKESMAQYQKKIDLFTSQMAILEKQMPTNIIIAQIQRLREQIVNVRAGFAQVQGDFERLTAQESDARNQIDTLRSTILQLQKEIDEASNHDNTTKEDKMNITETEAIIADIGEFRDSLDTLKGEIYSLEQRFNIILSDIRAEKYTPNTLLELDTIDAALSPLQKRIEQTGVDIHAKDADIQASLFVRLLH